MADTKISALSAGTPTLDDLIPFVDDPSGTPITKKATIGATFAAVHASCRVKKTSGTTITTGLDTDVSFVTEDWDDAAFWDGGTPTRLTAPTTGVYLIIMATDWDSQTTGNRYLHIRHSADGNIRSVTQGGSPGDAHQCASIVYKMTAGQYVELRVFHNQGGNATLDAFSAEIVRLA